MARGSWTQLLQGRGYSSVVFSNLPYVYLKKKIKKTDGRYVEANNNSNWKLLSPAVTTVPAVFALGASLHPRLAFLIPILIHAPDDYFC